MIPVIRPTRSYRLSLWLFACFLLAFLGSIVYGILLFDPRRVATKTDVAVTREDVVRGNERRDREYKELMDKLRKAMDTQRVMRVRQEKNLEDIRQLKARLAR